MKRREGKPEDNKEKVLQSIIGNAPRKRRLRVLFPISARLVIFFAVILFVVLIIINVLVSGMVSQDLLVTAEEDNYTINTRAAAEAEYRLNTIRANTYILLDLIHITGYSSPAARQATALFFERTHYIAAIVIPGHTELINSQFCEVNEITPASVSSWVSRQTSSFERAARGEPLIINPSAELKASLVAMFYPWQRNGLEESALILFSPDGLAELFGVGHNSSFMVNMDGTILVHTDYRMMMNNANVSNHPLFTALLHNDTSDIKHIYTENGIRFFGAGRKLSLGGLAVFTAIEYELPFMRTAAAIHRNIYIIISVIFISFVLIWLLSRTITVPLRRLAKAMSRVESGSFDAEFNYRFPDEIGVLSEKFTQMEKSLEKREQFLNDFGRFTNAGGAAQ